MIEGKILLPNGIIYHDRPTNNSINCINSPFQI